MSLYNHVASKGDLLDGMADVVFSEIGLPSGEAGWKPARLPLGNELEIGLDLILLATGRM